MLFVKKKTFGEKNNICEKKVICEKNVICAKMLIRMKKKQQMKDCPKSQILFCVDNPVIVYWNLKNDNQPIV